MKPWETLDTTTVDGTTLTLVRHDREFLILADTVPLMSSRTHASEDALATAGCRDARLLPEPCVLVGGLGMGFTLRAALDLLPPAATIVVAELVPAVVAWNRGVLGSAAGHPLDDPRVRVVERDVAEVLRAATGRFDAALLDIDNGPSALTSHRNATLYAERGLAWTRSALRPGGTLAVWSARPDRQFARRLRSAGFGVALEERRGGPRGGAKHLIFVAQAPASSENLR